MIRLLFVLLVFLFAAIIVGSSNANLVATSSLDSLAITHDVSMFAPAACSHMQLTNIATTGVGTPQNDLVLGGPLISILVGNAGDDCIVGSGIIDQCIGGGGNDIFVNCDIIIDISAIDQSH